VAKGFNQQQKKEFYMNKSNFVPTPGEYRKMWFKALLARLTSKLGKKKKPPIMK
jgi:hypothetical protein